MVFACMAASCLTGMERESKSPKAEAEKKKEQRGMISQMASDFAKSSSRLKMPTPIQRAAASIAGGPTGLVVKAGTVDDKKERAEILKLAATMNINRTSEDQKRVAGILLDEKKASVELSLTQLKQYRAQYSRSMEAQDGKVTLAMAEEIVASKKHFKSSLGAAITYSVQRMKAADPNLPQELLYSNIYHEFEEYAQRCKEIEDQEFDLSAFLQELGITKGIPKQLSASGRIERTASLSPRFQDEPKEKEEKK